MSGLFNPQIWPNYTRAVIGPWGNDYGGRPFFSEAEKERRHELVRAKLREYDCDFLIVQNYFPPSTMGVHTSLYWLGCDNYFKNTYTLILPQDGPLEVIHGVKTSECDWRTDPYSTGDDMSHILKGAKRIAYDGLGLITHAFYNYLQEICPGVELVDFCQELAWMRAIKSEEEAQAVRNTCRIQDAMFRGAALFLRPGRTTEEIFGDITHHLLTLGGDPTEMPKILLFIGENRPVGPEDKLVCTAPRPADYRLTHHDFVEFTLETPGCGGYYAERSRYFFFEEPHPEIAAHFDEALKLQEYQLNYYRPGMTMQQLRDGLNAYKQSVGAAPETGHNWMTTEIRGIGNITVCRPLIQNPWEMFSLAENMIFDSIHKLAKNRRSLTLHETVRLKKDGVEIFGSYPQQITVL